MTTNIQSTLYLCKNVNLDPNYEYTIDFDSINTQASYFEGKIASEFDENEDYSFIRAEEAIKVYANIEDLLGINYLFYTNNDKRYYAFITKKEYVNDKCTKLYVKLDIMQSFMFDYEIQESFIDREHQDRYTAYDIPKFNLQQENLEIGSEYKTKSKQNFNSNIDNTFFYLIKAKEPLGQIATAFDSGSGLPTSYQADDQDLTTEIGEGQYVETGIYTYICASGIHELSLRENLFERRRDCFFMPDDINKDPRVISISIIKYLPEDIYETIRGVGTPVIVIDTSKTDRSFNGFICAYTTPAGLPTPNTLFRILSHLPKPWQNFTIDDEIPNADFTIETPTNIKYETKLYTYPYSYLRLNAFNEFSTIKRENFDGIKGLKLKLSLGVNGSTILYPINYNGANDNLFDMRQIKTTNDITLRTDKWLEYELNNKASINGGLVVSGLQTALGVGLGLATGGIGLAVAGGQALGFAGQIANEMIKRQDIKNQPDDIRPAVNDTIINFNTTGGIISLENVEIKEEFKNNIFKYFNHYGYKCNSFKIPNTRSRYYFNYIKTIGCNINSNIDADYISELKAIYDKGLTIWHYRDSTTFKGVNNYAYENAEINLLEG